MRANSCSTACCCFVVCLFFQMLQFPAPFTDEATVSETATATATTALPLPLPLLPLPFLRQCFTKKLKVPKVKKLFVPKPAPVLLPLSPSLQPSLPLPRQLKSKPIKKLLDPDYISTSFSGRKHGRDRDTAAAECVDLASVSLSPLSFDLVSPYSPPSSRAHAPKAKAKAKKNKAKGNRRKHKTVLQKLFVGDSPASIAESIVVNDMSEATNFALLQMSMNLFCSDEILLEDD
jgi:hypothetical protein